MWWRSAGWSTGRWPMLLAPARLSSSAATSTRPGQRRHRDSVCGCLRRGRGDLERRLGRRLQLQDGPRPVPAASFMCRLFSGGADEGRRSCERRAPGSGRRRPWPARSRPVEDKRCSRETHACGSSATKPGDCRPSTPHLPTSGSRVPIYGAAESLNLATAAAVCLYATPTAQRTRRHRLPGPKLTRPREPVRF